MRSVFAFTSEIQIPQTQSTAIQIKSKNADLPIKQPQIKRKLTY